MNEIDRNKIDLNLRRDKREYIKNTIITVFSVIVMILAVSHFIICPFVFWVIKLIEVK